MADKIPHPNPEFRKALSRFGVTKIRDILSSDLDKLTAKEIEALFQNVEKFLPERTPSPPIMEQLVNPPRKSPPPPSTHIAYSSAQTPQIPSSSIPNPDKPSSSSQQPLENPNPNLTEIATVLTTPSSMIELETELAQTQKSKNPSPAKSKKRKHIIGLDDEEEDDDTDSTEYEGQYQIQLANPTTHQTEVPIDEENIPISARLQLHQEQRPLTQKRTQPSRKRTRVEKGKAIVPSTGEKKLVVPLVVTEAFLIEHDFNDLHQLIKAQGWEQLCSEPVIVDPDQVRKFYSNYRTLQDHDPHVGQFTFDGESYFLPSSLLKRILKVPSEGFCNLPVKGWTTEGRAPILKRLFGTVPPQGKEVTTHGLSLLAKMAHQYITRVVVPRQEKRTTVTVHDAILLDLFLRKEKIDLPRLVVTHMGKISGRSHSLPYAAFVKKILVKEDIYQPEKEVEIGQELEMVNIQKMIHSAQPETTLPRFVDEESTTVLQTVNRLCHVTERILEVLLDIQGNLSTTSK